MSNATGLRRVFSGVQPTSDSLHLGNALGAVTQWAQLQDDHDAFFCVVDLHAITVPQDPEVLRRRTLVTAAQYLALGVDPGRSTVFVQSHVAAHTQLAWVLGCFTGFGQASRMTQFKDKSTKQGSDATTVGLFTYPVLQAADVLIYRATHVPVGDDQKQHLELARDIAQKFNNDYASQIAANGHGDAFFPLPEPLIQGPATRVMSLRDGTKKMSKSDPSEYAHIALTDDADTIVQKIRKAKTDAEPLPGEVAGLAGRPEADNLVGIFAALCDETKADVLSRFAGGQFSSFKSALADLTVAKLGPIRTEIIRLKGEPAYVDSVLAEGAEKARAIARPNMDAVKDVLGLVR